MLRLDGRQGRTQRQAHARAHTLADRIFIATLVVGFFAVAMLLVMIYPSPMHLLGLV